MALQPGVGLLSERNAGNDSFDHSHHDVTRIYPHIAPERFAGRHSEGLGGLDPPRSSRYYGAGIVKTSAKAVVPTFCCFAVFAWLAWQIHGAGGEFRLDKGYKVEIVVHGPDGKIIPAIGRAPR